ncbi:MAG: hypothetical protein ACTSP4_00745 [Candidatus Hodarchaeales archaeon]
MKINLDKKILKAMVLFTGKCESRLNLTGVHIKIENNIITYEATTGHILAQFQTNIDNTGKYDIIISRDSIKRILTGYKKRDKTEFELDIKPEDLIHEEYCDFKRLWMNSPQKVKKASFNGDYLGVFGKASKILTDSRMSAIEMHFYGEGIPCEIKIPLEDKFRGLIMPLRID